MRLFVAIGVPVETKKELESLRSKFAKFASIKLVEPQNIHLTLKFLGEVNEGSIEGLKAALASAAAKCQKLKATPTAAGAFPDTKNPRVIWVGLQPADKIAALQRSVEEELEKLGVERETRFESHITLGRVKTGGEKAKIAQTLSEVADFKGKEFLITSFKLMKSTLAPQGPIYEELASFELR